MHIIEILDDQTVQELALIAGGGELSERSCIAPTRNKRKKRKKRKKHKKCKCCCHHKRHHYQRDEY